MDELPFTPAEMMVVAAARRFRNRSTCFVGVGLPTLAACVARSLHAPDAVLVYESGAIGAKPRFPSLSAADLELAATADFIVSLPEIFSYWLQAGRIEMAVLGAAQVDRFGNLNSTVIGDYLRPKVRLPGAGGAPEIAAGASDITIVVKHSARTLVPQVDFVTTPLRGKSHLTVVTDLAVLEPDPLTGELTLVSCHPGVSAAQICAATGWSLVMPPFAAETPAPSREELLAVREINSRAKDRGN